jgi:methylmalonyl-CoA/ethylmalonyl-CoA epimerase
MMPGSNFRFDHIGVVVPTLAEGRTHLSRLFGITRWTREFDDAIHHVRAQFGQDSSGLCYETLCPLGDRSPVLRALQRGERVLNHLAYLVDDLESSAAQLVHCGCVPTGAANAGIAYGGNPVQFFVSPLKFMIELVEAATTQHIFLASPSEASNAL